MAKLHLKLVAPSKKRAVTPTRRPNAEIRTREHLTETEIEKLLKAAGTNRWGHRDGTMILVAYRHGASGRSWWTCARTKSISPPPPCTSAGSSRAHLRPIRFSATNWGPYAGYSGSRNRSRHSCSRPNVARRSARRALLAWWSALVRRPSWASRPHPHMLRHACGFALANRGQYPRPASLPWPSQYPAHDALHRAGARSVQGVLALMWDGREAFVFPRYPSPRPEITHQRLALRTGARYRPRKARHNRPG